MKHLEFYTCPHHIGTGGRESIQEAVKGVGGSSSCICQCCKGHRKYPSSGGFKWEYAIKNNNINPHLQPLSDAIGEMKKRRKDRIMFHQESIRIKDPENIYGAYCAIDEIKVIIKDLLTLEDLLTNSPQGGK